MFKNGYENDGAPCPAGSDCPGFQLCPECLARPDSWDKLEMERFSTKLNGRL
jgi:hypothetical protein